MGRKCAVPNCYTGYRRCKDKASLYKVPNDDLLLSKWQEAIAREDRPITPKDFVCEKHFRDEDILRRRVIKDVTEEYQRPKLKSDAIPSIFPDLPEYILKMTKKRRKISTESNEVIQLIGEIDSEIDEFDTLKKDEKITDNSVEKPEVMNLNKTSVLKSEQNYVQIEKNKTVRNFRCSRCSYKTHSQNLLENHLLKHQFRQSQPKTKIFKCSNCPYKTLFSDALEDHQKTRCKANEFHCKECPHTFDTKTDYIKHILSHRNTTVETVNCKLTSRTSQSEGKILHFDTVLIKEEDHSDDEFVES